jgi:hypothetical protein
MKKPHIEERLDHMLLYIFENQDQLHWLAKAANSTESDEYINALSDEYAKEK